MKVLFIGNDASRTGAPIGLLHLLRWLRVHTDIECELLLRVGGGPLQPEYETLCNVVAYSDLWSELGPPQQLARRMGRKSLMGKTCLSPIEEHYQNAGIDLIYANTITHGGILCDLRFLPCPVLCHVHELGSVIKRYGFRNSHQVKARTTHYVADSEATRQHLIKTLRLAPSKVDLAYEFIVVDDLVDNPGSRYIRETLRLPKDAFIVGGSGHTNWRKGKDLFIELAAAVKDQKNDRDIRFVWVGGDATGKEADELQRAIREAKVADIVTIVPQVPNPIDYFAGFDVFALTSREEPFGIVILEAAFFECPTICFSHAGGAPEFVERDAGLCLPYLDVGAMADKVKLLSRDEPLRRHLGQRAAAKLRERHDVSVVAPQLAAIIRRVGGDSRG
ncbi:MAG: glycosyltransferase family 4 protein [Verrucomicrobia bacterium]|nr:glycosyltransferase family 4 protein [Verrucomicrobiota bacterium]